MAASRPPAGAKREAPAPSSPLPDVLSPEEPEVLSLAWGSPVELASPLEAVVVSELESELEPVPHWLSMVDW